MPSGRTAVQDGIRSLIITIPDDRAETSWVGASNAPTARWAKTSVEPGFVMSGASVWPLLALLAGGTAGADLAELESALGIPGSQAMDAASAALEGMDRAAGVCGRSVCGSERTFPWTHRGPMLSPPRRSADLSVSLRTIAPC